MIIASKLTQAYYIHKRVYTMYGYVMFDVRYQLCTRRGYILIVIVCAVQSIHMFA